MIATKQTRFKGPEALRFKSHLLSATKKEKTRYTNRCSEFILVAEMGFEPHDLRVMSPASYQTAPLRDILVPEAGVEPVREKISRDFKSRASANSAIPANIDLCSKSPNYYSTMRGKCQVTFEIFLPFSVFIFNFMQKSAEILPIKNFELSFEEKKYSPFLNL